MPHNAHEIRTARKEHQCTERSYHTIKPGDKYLSMSIPPWNDFTDGDKWIVIKACLRCANEFGLHTPETRKAIEDKANAG